MANPVGPVFTGGFEEFVIQDEAEAGESPALLFLPPGNTAHNAYKFRRIYFVGGFDETTASPLESEVEGVYG